MKQYLVVLFAFWLLSACDNNHTHSEEKEELKDLSYTLYTDKSELFVEFKPLVAGHTSKFVAHLTRLGENFVPYTEGTVNVTLFQNGNELKDTATVPSSPGIFRLALHPTLAGLSKLVFEIKTAAFNDRIIIDSIEVYDDEKTAIAAQSAEVVDTDISYLKEQAWKVEFANAPVQKQTIYNVVKATGEILPWPGDEVTVTARSRGMVKFAGNVKITGAAIKAGQTMFTIAGGEIPFENVAAAKQSARAELISAQMEFGRASELINDKLITQGEFQTAKLRLQNAQIALNNLIRNYSAGGNSLSSPISGYIKNIMVSEGQFVSAGQPLATITKNERLVLRADVSLKDADRVTNIQEANFTLIQNNLTYNTKNLNGKILSIAKTISDKTPYVPLHLQIDGRPGIIPGSFVEVYLKTNPIYNALVIPTKALIEEQGVFYAYVQTEGESFQKRELKLGADDGEMVQVLSGLAEGERVVIKGAYQIRLSQGSGTIPAHGHDH